MLKLEKPTVDNLIYDYNWTNPSPYVLQFCEWLKINSCCVKNVLDLGCGGHHLVGRTASELGIKCIGTTISYYEIAEYIEIYKKTPNIMKNYFVLFHNWEYFQPELFIKFDVILGLEITYKPSCKLKDVEKILNSLRFSLNDKGRICLNNSTFFNTETGKNRVKIISDIIKQNDKSEFYKDLVFI